jgi:hypothetical protein
MSHRIRTRPRIGRPSLFRHKLRAPVSITLSRRHHAKVKRATRRLKITRSDLFALLVDRFADSVKI